MSRLYSKPVIGRGRYPEKDEPHLDKFEQFTANMGGLFAPWFRPGPGRFKSIVKSVNNHGSSMEDLSDKELLDMSLNLRPLLRREGFREDLVAKSFALVREAARRTAGMRHFDVQLIGGLVLLNGMVAEMETGEGKTLVATLPACTAALAGVPVHIITVNDYLARRDSEWMSPIYECLGLTVGTVSHGMDPVAKQNAYGCDITYCTNKEIAFDYLRDRIVLWDRPTAVRLKLEQMYGEKSRVNKLLLRGLHFAIVDEADSVLVDEARTPLIISSEGAGAYDPSVYQNIMGLAKSLVERSDYTVSSSERSVELTHRGKARIGALDWDEVKLQASEEQRNELVRQALVALHLFSRDKHYLIKDGKIQIIDEYTGRLMADRSWERGLHQFIEVKEDCEVSRRKDTRARISYQRFFRRYLRLSGMTGTAREVAGELWSIYRMPVVTIPPNKRVKRKLLADRVYRKAENKWGALIKTVSRMHEEGRPVLVGTRSVEASEHLSMLMTESNMAHKVLNARQDKEEAEIIAEAGQTGRVTVATNMAGRGTDIRLGPDVADLGGLFVIASERHESRRIDRQLFGRCGRQGDPGRCVAFVSLEDELMSVYIGKGLRWLTSLLLSIPGFGWIGRLIGKALFRRAQRAAERLHTRMRRDLLKMDEQLSETLAFAGRPE